MKILHVLAQLPCATGSGVYFTNLIRQLERYGHDQRAVFALQDDFAAHLPADRQYPVRFKTADLPFPVPGMSDAMPYDSTKYCDMDQESLELWTGAFRRTLERAAADFQPDVLVLHHLWLLTSLALEILPNTRSVGVCHHTDLRQARQNPGLCERRVTNLHRLDAILSLSDSDQEAICEIHSRGREGIITVGGGFDSALFFPRPERRPEGPVKILYAGKIDPSKGVFELIEAFSSLRQRDPDLRLSVVGTPNREHAGRLEEMTGGAPGISLHPALPQAELARTMREHDIFAMPSFFEGLGLIAVEALASGLWTVATEIEGLRSLLGERVIHSGAIEFMPLPPLDGDRPREARPADFIGELAARLERQADRVRRGLDFPEGVRDDIARHSWEAIASRINEVITKQP